MRRLVTVCRVVRQRVGQVLRATLHEELFEAGISYLTKLIAYRAALRQFAFQTARATSPTTGTSLMLARNKYGLAESSRFARGDSLRGDSPYSGGDSVVEQHMRHEAVGNVKLASGLDYQRVVENRIRDVSETGDDTCELARGTRPGSCNPVCPKLHMVCPTYDQFLVMGEST